MKLKTKYQPHFSLLMWDSFSLRTVRIPSNKTKKQRHPKTPLFFTQGVGIRLVSKLTGKMYEESRGIQLTYILQG